MDTVELPEELDQLVRDEVRPGERLIWLQQPEPRGKLPIFSYIPALFGIPFTAFAVLWTGMALWIGGKAAGQGPPGLAMVFPLFGIPFVLVGLGLMSSPFWLKRRIRQSAARTVYAITDRRAIIFDGGYYGEHMLLSGLAQAAFSRGGVRIRSFGPERMTDRERVQRTDGTGDVLFAPETAVAMNSISHGSTMHTTSQVAVLRSGFYSVTDVRHVDDLLQELADQARHETSQS